MRTRKPDRWERMLAKWVHPQGLRPQDMILVRDALRLLRAEHRAMVRLVRPRRVTAAVNVDNAYNAACRDILAKLKARAR